MIKSGIKYIHNNRSAVFIYLIIGIIAFVVDYGLFYILFTIFILPLFLANAVGLVGGFLISFFGNRRFAFNSDSSNTHYSLNRQVLLYVILLFFNSFISYGVIWLCQVFGIAAVIGKVFAMSAIIVWNFAIYQKVIFRKE